MYVQWFKAWGPSPEEAHDCRGLLVSVVTEHGRKHGQVGAPCLRSGAGVLHCEEVATARGRALQDKREEVRRALGTLCDVELALLGPSPLELKPSQVRSRNTVL